MVWPAILMMSVCRNISCSTMAFAKAAFQVVAAAAGIGPFVNRHGDAPGFERGNALQILVIGLDFVAHPVGRTAGPFDQRLVNLDHIIRAAEGPGFTPERMIEPLPRIGIEMLRHDVDIVEAVSEQVRNPNRRGTRSPGISLPTTGSAIP